MFDESASANARPVQPLPTNRVALSSQSARDAWPGVSARAITLTLAIIAALAIGAVSGAMLVKHQESTETSSDIQEASAITTEESDLSDGNSAPPDDNGSQSIPMAAQGTVGAAPRLRRHRVVEEGRASNARIGLL